MGDGFVFCYSFFFFFDKIFCTFFVCQMEPTMFLIAVTATVMFWGAVIAQKFYHQLSSLICRWEMQANAFALPLPFNYLRLPPLNPTLWRVQLPPYQPVLGAKSPLLLRGSCSLSKPKSPPFLFFGCTNELGFSITWQLWRRARRNSVLKMTRSTAGSRKNSMTMYDTPEFVFSLFLSLVVILILEWDQPLCLEWCCQCNWAYALQSHSFFLLRILSYRLESSVRLIGFLVIDYCLLIKFYFSSFNWVIISVIIVASFWDKVIWAIWGAFNQVLLALLSDCYPPDTWLIPLCFLAPLHERGIRSLEVRLWENWFNMVIEWWGNV